MTNKEEQTDIDVELVTKATAEVELQVLRDLQAEDKAMATLIEEKETDEDKDPESK